MEAPTLALGTEVGRGGGGALGRPQVLSGGRLLPALVLCEATALHTKRYLAGHPHLVALAAWGHQRGP